MRYTILQVDISINYMIVELILRKMKNELDGPDFVSVMNECG